MRTNQYIGLIILMLWGTLPSFAENNTLTVNSELRSRAEYRNGSIWPRSAGDDAAFFINNRARISADYRRNNLDMKLSTQHVSVWGEDPQIDRNGRLMLNEAWAKLKFDEFFVQVGRQPLSYDDERILGGLDWNVSGRFHDALKAGYQNDNHTAHLILAFNQAAEGIAGTYYIGGQPYKSMQTLWYHFGKPASNLNISVLAMNLGWQLGVLGNPDNAFMQTLGTHANYKFDAFDFTGSFYYQLGKNNIGNDVSAYMGSLFAKLKLTDDWSVGIGSDYLSGHKNGSAISLAFNPLYGTHHKFYGTMDYFYASPFTIGFNPGLWDNQLAVTYKTSKTLDFSLNYHYFSTASDVVVGSTTYKKGLGSEIDLQFNWSIMPDVKLIGGYSFMLGTETMDVVKGGDHKLWQDWGWISLNISPTLFSSKK